ncbi:SDR family NAD(P)-dependent oxidoreductase [Sphingobium estronivorans]|uniref:SDR family NAD(P)-dependent oxidoreductase n=1 Tax=Sphingobium estronivorans TaxID=1577690 RepID=UPI00123AE76E|nr:SDR family oxidoreductase [Sphingobium estronivorans]
MTNGFDLRGKVALVTGASGGLGAHFAKVLAQAGAEVIIGARRKDAMDHVAEAITASGAVCEPVTLDVSDAGSIAAIAPRLSRVDILVNNAGVVRDAAALHQTEADWDVVIDTNLKGMFLMSQSLAKAMKARGRGGSIINIASILGLRQAGGVVPYAVSKAGAIQMTRSLALEWARLDIRVNALAPGYLETELNSDFWQSDAGKAMIKRIPQRRLGRLEDLDGPLLLLASDMSQYMTGSVIEVDGGHLVSTL